MRAIELYAGLIADAVLDGKASLPEVALGDDDFVELDADGNVKKARAKKKTASKKPVRKKVIAKKATDKRPADKAEVKAETAAAESVADAASSTDGAVKKVAKTKKTTKKVVKKVVKKVAKSPSGDEAKVADEADGASTSAAKVPAADTAGED